jgi:lysophospholipase L1-like esterase
VSQPAERASAQTSPPSPIRSYVAVGDSFTEGLDDAYPTGSARAGTFRGWADLVAERLAAEGSAGTAPFRYANLAIRGKLIGQILNDQIPVAAAMNADLVTLAGGLNDVMRPGCDIDAVCADLARCAEAPAANGATVVMFRSMDFSRRMKSSARLTPKVARLIDQVDQMAAQHGVITVDLASAPVFDDPRLWAVDRIHLSAEGHRRVAEAVLEALGRTTAFDWRAPLAARKKPGRLARTAADLIWLVTFLAPWVKRRLTGKSSGDGVPAKRPDLAPLD